MRDKFEKDRKVLIIGLDGGTWSILNPLTEKSLLPYLKNSQEKTSGILNFPIFPVPLLLKYQISRSNRSIFM